jgi:hypothetical protein
LAALVLSSSLLVTADLPMRSCLMFFHNHSQGAAGRFLLRAYQTATTARARLLGQFRGAANAPERKLAISPGLERG